MGYHIFDILRSSLLLLQFNKNNADKNIIRGFITKYLQIIDKDKPFVGAGWVF